MRIQTGGAYLVMGLVNQVVVSGGLLLVVRLLHERGLEFLDNFGQLKGYRGLPWPRLGGLRAVGLEAAALVFGFVHQGLATPRILLNLDAQRGWRPRYHLALPLARGRLHVARAPAAVGVRLPLLRVKLVKVIFLEKFLQVIAGTLGLVRRDQIIPYGLRRVAEVS